MAKKENTNLKEFEFGTLEDLQQHLLDALIDESEVYFTQVLDAKGNCKSWSYEYHKTGF
jgi:hypothetical protein